MTTEVQEPLRIFCSYSHKDETYLNELRTWLRRLERQGLIEWWHDREIPPGWEWEEAIDKNLRSADIILLLVTPDFMASDYVFEKEIDRAIERHERGEARVIPIIVRPADWEGASLDRLQALPKDAKPITTWLNRDEAWLDVARGIRKAVEELLAEREERVAAKERYRKAVEEAWADNQVSDAEAEGLGTLARDLGLSVDTAAGIEREVLDDTKEAILERQEQAAREIEGIERRKRLDERYAEARRLHHTRKWQSVVDVFERIHAEDPAYPDREGLLASAREALEAQERAHRVAANYDQGLRHMDAQEWQQALQRFEEVQRLEPNYRETQALLAQIRQQESSDHAEKAEASERSRGKVAGRPTEQATRVQPDYSADTQPQPPLSILGGNWWALALAGVIIALHGLLDSFTFTRPDVFFRLLASSLLIVIGVFTIIASRTAHPRLLLRTQGMISGSAGLVAFLSGAIALPSIPASLTEALQNTPSLIVYYLAFEFWGICLGIIQIIAAIRFGWTFKFMWLTVVSGASLVIYGVYGFSFLYRWDPTSWLLFIWLAVSGISLAVFAFSVRQWEEAEIER